MKIYKVNVNGLDYHVQLTEATAKEIGAVLVDSQKKPAAPAEKPAAPAGKPGPKPKAQTEKKEEKKG